MLTSILNCFKKTGVMLLVVICTHWLTNGPKIIIFHMQVGRTSMAIVAEQTESCMHGYLFVSKVSLRMYGAVQAIRKRTSTTIATRTMLICLFHLRAKWILPLYLFIYFVPYFQFHSDVEFFLQKIFETLQSGVKMQIWAKISSTYEFVKKDTLSNSYII